MKKALSQAQPATEALIEAADGGTLFLDEIGELPLAAQARLLRYIQEGEIRRIGSNAKVDARLICATHRNLRMLADSASFGGFVLPNRCLTSRYTGIARAWC